MQDADPCPGLALVHGQTPQRRPAAVVFIDVVGYTRLMELDEEGTYQNWMALRSDVIEPFLSLNGGHVVNGTGDGFLLMFNGGIDAVKFALDVQRSLGTKSGAADQQNALRSGSPPIFVTSYSTRVRYSEKASILRHVSWNSRRRAGS